MSDLSSRVLNAVPAGAYEMNALLSLLRVEETETVATASISCERRPVLRINPTFVRRHCRSDDHLFLLVMHELHHVLLGHTRLFPRSTRAHNIAFDAVINAMLVQRFPAESHRSFFVDLYRAEDGVMRLLAPPAGAEITQPALRRLHHLLYEDQGATSEEVFNAVVEQATAESELRTGDRSDRSGGQARDSEAHHAPPWVPPGDRAGARSGTPVSGLLGEHAGEGETGWGTEGQVDDQFVRAIRDIVEKWPPPEAPVTGRSLADVLTQSKVRIQDPAPAIRAALRRALLGAANINSQHQRSRTAPRSVRIQHPVPSASDRRAAVIRQSGGQALLYQRPAPARRGRIGCARVYIDVSGSMAPYVALLYGALASLQRHVERDVFLFSTVVSAVSRQDFGAGVVISTGGTEIRCVFEHALEHRLRKILIVTDGYVGSPTPAQAVAIRCSRLEVRVALTPGGWRNDLVGIASRMDELPTLSGPSQRPNPAQAFVPTDARAAAPLVSATYGRTA